MQPRQVLVLGLVLLVLRRGDAAFDYGLALTKSLLYFEAQRSGRLPTDQRVQWRDDSALTDGNDANVRYIFPGDSLYLRLNCKHYLKCYLLVLDFAFLANKLIVYLCNVLENRRGKIETNFVHKYVNDTLQLIHFFFFLHAI